MSQRLTVVGYTLRMRLVLDAAENAAHGEWLRSTPGAYEWWYFDARSDCGLWTIAAIWFLGNPFSPYYRQAAQGKFSDPLVHNALFFALYRNGKLYAYHFTRFPDEQIETPAALPGTLRLGANLLEIDPCGLFTLTLQDENANGRRLDASLCFEAPPLSSQPAEEAGVGHSDFWLPVAPSCRVSGNITLRGPQNGSLSEQITFQGHGYHDHNWGKLPFNSHLKDWYWARAALPCERAVILYHVRSNNPYGSARPESHLLLFESGKLLLHDPDAQVSLSRRTINGFGMLYATRLAAESGALQVRFDFGTRLDSAPFYLRVLCAAEVISGGVRERGQGVGEYFRPRLLASPLVASATKARIVTR